MYQGMGSSRQYAYSRRNVHTSMTHLVRINPCSFRGLFLIVPFPLIDPIINSSPESILKTSRPCLWSLTRSLTGLLGRSWRTQNSLRFEIVRIDFIPVDLVYYGLGSFRGGLDWCSSRLWRLTECTSLSWWIGFLGCGRAEFVFPFEELALLWVVPVKRAGVERSNASAEIDPSSPCRHAFPDSLTSCQLPILNRLGHDPKFINKGQTTLAPCQLTVHLTTPSSFMTLDEDSDGLS